LHETKLGPYVDKIKEWIVAIKLERDYTKKEIMAMYLNTMEFGSNAFGIQVASKTFFNKTPGELNVQEAAVLVGMLQAPTRLSPVFNYDNSLRRRNTVISQMHKYGFLSSYQSDSIRSMPIELDYNVESHNEGMATYFRSVIRGFLLDWCREQNIDLFSSGLRIYATIDSRMQRYAEEAVQTKMAALQQRFENHWKGRNPWIDESGREIKDFLERQLARTDHYRSLVREYGRNADTINVILNTPRRMKVFTYNGEIDTLLSPIDSLKYYKRFLQTGFMAMDPHSGDIKAWVGGINHRYFKFDHVMQGKRQPGSTFKPVVYTAAIDNYFSPCYPVIDAPVTFNLPGQNPPSWTPSNADGRYSGQTLTLRQAMARSVNSVTAFVMKRIGPEMVVEYARKLGIRSHLDAVPSLCLGGGGEVSVYELVGAYATFVNQGVYTEPRYISRIEDKNGNVWIFPPRTQEALSEETAFVMVHMLMGGAEPGGTAIGLNRELRVDNEIGGKTGTTQNASDGWFVGITHDLVAGGWVGGDERAIRFRNWFEGQGGRTAMPIWEEFMLKVYADKSLGYEKGRFKRPERGLSVELDCQKYKNTTPVFVESDTTYQRPVFDGITVEDIF
jgi:penicillin-binding protein 1A